MGIKTYFFCCNFVTTPFGRYECLSFHQSKILYELNGFYRWDINKLVKALQAGTITGKQKKRYWITFWVLVALTVFSLPGVYNPSSMNGYDVIDLILFFIINMIAIYLLVGIYKKRMRKE
ncbi:hypothetical protein ACQKOM_22305 [Peribacillus frigoritolerans]|uniref:hypothetical protein n=1 Tax=Peribacillus frigoritolerans TaxID=450367 RepID=UPI003D06585D